MTEKVLAWHFVGATLRDGRPVPADGEALRHDGPLVMCESGLHASVRIIDALQYALGETICRVECGGEVDRGVDKLVATKRMILWRVDGKKLLRKFARTCTLDVAHLWKMPKVVRQYLETGDEALRAVASAVASDAAWAAVSAVASAVARAATWAAASAAASAAAAGAANAAAWAARAAARDAASDAQNVRLTAIVETEHAQDGGP